MIRHAPKFRDDGHDQGRIDAAIAKRDRKRLNRLPPGTIDHALHY